MSRIAGAQATTGVPAVDSASVARAAWSRAAEAMRANDLAAARKNIERAASAWPTQSAYAWARAALSARAGDSDATLTSLIAYSRLGLGRDLRLDSAFARYAARPSFARAMERLRADAAPFANSHVVATIPDSTFWAEGVDYDPASRTYFVGSVRHRTIARIAADGNTTYLWPADRRDVGAIFGVRVDTLRHGLWATTSGVPQMSGYSPADSTIAALLEIRLSDGTIERRWTLPARPGGHVLGDLAIGPDGDVFLTDSNEPMLYRLRPGADTLEAMTHPLFRSLQGLAPTPDGRAVYVADYSHGLLRVDLATHAVVRVADAPESTSLGCDGIAWDRGAIIAVQNGTDPRRVVRFVLDESGERVARLDVVDQNLPLAPEPIIGTVVGREFVYVANGLWDEFDDNGRMKSGAKLSKPRLLAASIDHVRPHDYPAPGKNDAGSRLPSTKLPAPTAQPPRYESMGERMEPDSGAGSLRSLSALHVGSLHPTM